MVSDGSVGIEPINLQVSTRSDNRRGPVTEPRSTRLSASRSAVFLDRDGIVNRRLVGDYVRSIDQFEFLPEIFAVLPEIRRSGRLAVLVTNQRGIARGLMSEHRLEEIHAWMQQQLRERTGCEFDAIYYCPHHRDAGCDCRKPRPGMLLQAIREHHIDPASSWMVGDSESDVQAGAAAGCPTILVAPEGTSTSATLRVASLLDALDPIRRND